MHDPCEPSYTTLKRILCYVRGATGDGLQIFSSYFWDLIVCLSADWDGCLVTRRSTFGYDLFLGHNLLYWSSKRQHTISRSSAESEYRDVANVVAEKCLICNLLLELHYSPHRATIVYCDNVSVDCMSQNPTQH